MPSTSIDSSVYLRGAPADGVDLHLAGAGAAPKVQITANTTPRILIYSDDFVDMVAKVEADVRDTPHPIEQQLPTDEYSLNNGVEL